MKVTVTIAVAFALAAHVVSAASANEHDVQRSPRIATLAREIETGNRQALAAFWKNIGSKAPLVEAIDGNPWYRRVTFVWRATNDTARVTMMGGLPAANLLKPLYRLADSDLWYL